MADDVLTEIITLCLAIDEKAVQVYTKLHDSTEREELREFWRTMTEDENSHVEFWRESLDMVSQGLLPQIFADPFQVRDSLENTRIKADALLDRCRDPVNLTTSFILAYRMEFYLLHPAFEQLFHFLGNVIEEKRPADAYDEHIDLFVQAINKFGGSTPELELLGETLKRLWDDNRRLAIQSHTDPLTGAYNRRGFFEALKTLAHLAFRNQYNVAVMMMDIDHFKRVNDTHGHKTGDSVLKSVGAVLTANTRASDLLGRYGGEEFVLFLSPINVENLQDVAEKLRRSVEDNIEMEVPVTISIGAAQDKLGSAPEEETHLLMERADENLYKAKQSGRNCVIVS